MKLNSAHLTFCTNIYAGESWSAHFAVLKDSFPKLKAALSPDQPMGIGLRLSNLASIELLNEEHLNAFKQWLDVEGGYVFTMNGFPYGGFHHTRVKDQVHAPDWTTTERLDYTLRLAEILSQLVPAHMDAGISTSPLSYKPWFENAADRKAATIQATAHVLAVAGALNKIHQTRGKLIHLDIEPEPDGFLESGPEFIDWYENELLSLGKTTWAADLGFTAEKAEEIIKTHINLCYDVCHFAIGYEPHAAIVQELQEKGIKVGKIQISAALKAHLPESSADRKPVLDALAGFDEPVYLHQVIAQKHDGGLIRYPDLSNALADAGRAEVKEWRAHFHVPIFVEEMGLIQSTQSDIKTVLALQKSNPFTNHLEVETYTWEVLPAQLKAPLNESIIRELEWVKNTLAQ